MATVRLLDAHDAPLLARRYYAEGDPGPIVAALAQVPELLEVALPFISAALGPSAISWREKELVIVRTSALLQCSYCVATHTVVALDAGVSGDEVRALRSSTDAADVFGNPRESVLIRWVDALALGRGPLAAEVTAGLHKHWDDHEIVELTILVGATMMLNRMATALELPISEDTIGELAAAGLPAGSDVNMVQQPNGRGDHT